MGSVKDLKVFERPTSNAFGRGEFIFSDRYSVFDWGEMPDHIPYKGAAIALLGAYFFEKLEERNIPTHYIGLVEDTTVKKLSELKQPTHTLEVKLLNVLTPQLRGDQYDYSIYENQNGCFLIPLELIYRNILPPGSSVFKRLKEGQISTEDLGLQTIPKPHQKLPRPILDVSTKLEITDRYLTWPEAQQISGLSDRELTELKTITYQVNDLITKEFSKIGLDNEDGKIELGFDPDRRLMVVDVLGTLDECRFTFDGMPVSKEIARIHYRNTPWFHAVEEAKNKDRQNWKKICSANPDPLPPKLKLLISQVYCACTNEVTQNNWFVDVPPLIDVLKEIKKIDPTTAPIV